MPLLLRQSLRSSLQFTRTTARPVQVPHLRPTPPSAFPARPTTRSFSVCLQCQFRRLPGSYSPIDEKDKTAAEIQRIIQTSNQGVAPDGVADSDAAAGASRASSTEAEVSSAGETQMKGDKILLEGPEAGQKEGTQNTNAHGAPSGRLPSYLENRRSQLSKQFTTMMDNLQSNVFVAGQRLNDLTGYSAIETLKKDIQTQGKKDSPPTIPYSEHLLTLRPLSVYRSPPPHSSCPCSQSKGRLHSRNQQSLHLPARSQRAAPAQARLVPNRPGAIHPALPQRPHQRSRRGRDTRGTVSCGA